MGVESFATTPGGYGALCSWLEVSTSLTPRTRSWVRGLKEMNDLRVRYAHSWVVLGQPDDEGERPYYFRRYKDGQEKETRVTRAEMDAQLEKQVALYGDLLRVGTAILKKRAGRSYWNAVDANGTTKLGESTP
jgi:hypothetical protein